MFILKKGHQPGVYLPLRALFLVDFAYLGHPNISWKVFICLCFILQLGRIKRSKVCNVTRLHRNINLRKLQSQNGEISVMTFPP